MVRNVNVVEEEELTRGQQLADRLTELAGSWPFIGTFVAFAGVWMVVNTIAAINHWDPYPFIFLNLVLSLLAAVEAPVILMSQNRQSDRDRLQSDLDYETNVLSHEHLEHVEEQLEEIKALLKNVGPPL